VESLQDIKSSINVHFLIGNTVYFQKHVYTFTFNNLLSAIKSFSLTVLTAFEELHRTIARQNVRCVAFYYDCIIMSLVYHLMLLCLHGQYGLF
jgi:hypothetical protein